MTFTLAHLSDLHMAPLPRLKAQDFFSKRFFGYLNWWRGRANMHRMEILSRLIEDVRAQRPDHIAITGDLTNLGLIDEYKAAKDWLQTLGPAAQVSVVPGNHDAYVKGALEHGLPHLSPWMERGFPFTRVVGDIVIIHLSSAIATAPFLATGRVGEEQLVQLPQILKQHEGKFRIVLLHHALETATHEFSRYLTDSEALKKILITEGAELVLHGHLHRETYHKVGKAHVFGVPSASADPARCHAPAGYALYRIEKNGGGWQVNVKRRTMRKDYALKTSEETNLLF